MKPKQFPCRSGPSGPVLFQVSFYNDPVQEVAKTQTRTQSRKLATCRKVRGRKDLSPLILHLDPLEIKIGPPKRGALPRRNLTHHLQNTYNSKPLDGERCLLRCFWLSLTHTRKATHPKESVRLVCHHHFYFLSSLLSCSRASFSSSVSKDCSPFPCSFVMSLYVPSTRNACGYLRCKSASLDTISSLDSWSML